MINANAPVVVVELGKSNLPLVSNLDVAVSNIGVSISADGGSVLTINSIAPDIAGNVALTPADIGAAAALGVNDHYVTDAEKTILSNTSGTNTGDQDLSTYALTSDLLATKYSPASVTIVAGTLVSGDITSLSNPDDGNLLRVNETTGGLTVEFEYHNIVEFTTITERLQYIGGSAHVLQRLYYNWLTSTWDVIGEFTGTQIGLTWMTVGTPESSAYIGTGVNAGVVKTRRHHTAPFNTSHYLLFDYAGAISSVGGVAVGAPTQAQAEDITSDSTTLYSWSVQRLKQFVTAWWATISGNYLARIAGIATGIKETKIPTITVASAAISWSAGHVVWDYAGTPSITSFTDIPTDGTESYLTVTVLHNGGIRTLGIPAATLGTLVTSGTSGGWDVHVFFCLGDGIVRTGGAK